MKKIFSLHDSKANISFLFQTGEIWVSDNLMEPAWDIQIPMHTDTHAYADRWTMLKASWFFLFPDWGRLYCLLASNIFPLHFSFHLRPWKHDECIHRGGVPIIWMNCNCIRARWWTYGIAHKSKFTVHTVYHVSTCLFHIVKIDPLLLSRL